MAAVRSAIHLSPLCRSPEPPLFGNHSFVAATLSPPLMMFSVAYCSPFRSTPMRSGWDKQTHQASHKRMVQSLVESSLWTHQYGSPVPCGTPIRVAQRFMRTRHVRSVPIHHTLAWHSTPFSRSARYLRRKRAIGNSGISSYCRQLVDPVGMVPSSRTERPISRRRTSASPVAELNIRAKFLETWQKVWRISAVCCCEVAALIASIDTSKNGSTGILAETGSQRTGSRTKQS